MLEPSVRQYVKDLWPFIHGQFEITEVAALILTGAIATASAFGISKAGEVDEIFPILGITAGFWASLLIGLVAPYRMWSRHVRVAMTIEADQTYDQMYGPEHVVARYARLKVKKSGGDIPNCSARLSRVWFHRDGTWQEGEGEFRYPAGLLQWARHEWSKQTADACRFTITH